MLLEELNVLINGLKKNETDEATITVDNTTGSTITNGTTWADDWYCHTYFPYHIINEDKNEKSFKIIKVLKEQKLVKLEKVSEIKR